MDVVVILFTLIFFVPWLVNLLGLVDYEIPLRQQRDQIVRVELLDSENYPYTVMKTLTGEEMDAFLTEYLQLRAGQFANDPPTEQGLRTVRICYADGGYDELGDMVQHYDAAHQSIRLRGWFKVNGEEVDALFEKYLNDE